MILVFTGIGCGIKAYRGVKIYSVKWKADRQISYGGNNPSMMVKEVKKLLLENKGFLILMILVISAGLLAKAQKIRFTSISDYYYRKYSNEFSGLLTDEKKKQIEELEQTINNEFEKLEMMGISEGNNKYDDCKYRLTAVSMLREDVEYVENSKAEYLINQPAYKMLFGNYGAEFIMLILISLGTTVLVVPYYMKDRLSGMDDFCKSTRLGEKGFGRLKERNSVIFALLFRFAFSMTYMLILIEKFNINRLNIPALNYKGFSKIPFAFSLTAMLVLFELFGIIALLVVYCICRFTCRRFDGLVSAVLGSIASWLPFAVAVYLIMLVIQI